jgi:hypothetical protein
MKQTTALTEQDKSEQTRKTEESQAQLAVGRFAEISYDEFTPEHKKPIAL